MKRPALSQPCIRFGIFEFNPHISELRKQGLKVKLWPQAAKILSLLLERPGKTRTREELQRRLWPNDVFVDFERSLNRTIHALRGALGDSALNPRYIETVSGEGYRFIPIPQVRRTFALGSRNSRKIHSLAVLPISNESNDPELRFLSKRIVERLIDLLSRVPRLRVLAYRTVQHYRDGGRGPKKMGQDLLVRAVVAGEMFPRDDKLLLHLELIDVSDGSQLWGTQFNELFLDVLNRPEKLAESICEQLQPILAPAASKTREERSGSAA